MRHVKLAGTGIAVLAISLGIAGGIALAQSILPCSNPNDPVGRIFCSPNFRQDSMLDFGGAAPISGRSGLGGEDKNPVIDRPSMPAGGKLTFDDVTKVEREAYRLLTGQKQFRQDISPYQTDTTNFNKLISRFDQRLGGLGFEAQLNGASLKARLEQADKDLRLARDLYAYLAAHADEDRFRSYATTQADTGERARLGCQPGKTTNNNRNDDNCYFAGRMREAVRELANLRLIFGQQFTVYALGNYFDASLFGAEKFVKETELPYLQDAVVQYRLAESAIAEGMHISVGLGCYVSDFYSDVEWSLLSRASEGQEEAQHQVAVRKSYLRLNGQLLYTPDEVEREFISSASTQYVQVLGAAGLNARRAGACADDDTVPNANDIRKMTSQMLASRQQVRGYREGRNIFGYDISTTPDRPLNTTGEVKGLLNEAKEAWQKADITYQRVILSSRAFDASVTELARQVLTVKRDYDLNLSRMTGCNSQDPAFLNCVNDTFPKLNCSVSAADFDTCAAAIPNGTLKESLLNLRATYLKVESIKQSLRGLIQKADVEVIRNADVNQIIYKHAEWKSVNEFMLAQLESLSVSIGVSSGFLGFPSFSTSISFNPASPIIGALRSASTIQQAVADMRINGVNSTATVQGIMIDFLTRQSELIAAAQEMDAQAVGFNALMLEAQNLSIEAQRARNFTEDYLSKNPTTYKLQRDSERLLLVSQLERAARLSYLAARRAEFEYAHVLAWKDFRISDIYIARSPNDISQFLDRLEGVINNLPRPVQRNIKDYSISLAKHILHYDDTSLGLTGADAEGKRKQLFQTWVISNTVTNPDGSETLRIKFSTSILDKGLFSTFADQKSVWLQQLSAVGIPNGGKGLRINISASGPGAFRYRTVRVQHGGMTHLRADNGCLLDFRLMRTQELYWPQATQDNDSLAWQFQHNPKVVQGTLSAGVNDNVADPKEMTPANDFFSFPLSATGWQIDIDLKSPDGVLLPLPKTQLTDVEILVSTSFASRQSTDRPVDQCPRADK